MVPRYQALFLVILGNHTQSKCPFLPQGCESVVAENNVGDPSEEETFRRISGTGYAKSLKKVYCEYPLYSQ